MSDRLIIILGVTPAVIFLWYWFYRLAQMRRDVYNLTHIVKGDFWSRRKAGKKYELNLQREHFAVRCYRAFVARVTDSIILDRSADSERAGD